MKPRVGVCSWSLKPETAAQLVERMREVGVRQVQLALDPLRRGAWPIEECRERVGEAGFEICSGMLEMTGEDYATLASIRRTGGVRSAARWEANVVTVHESAALARRLQIPLVSFHAGFIPHDARDPLRSVMVERLRVVVDRFDRSAYSLVVALYG